LPDFTWYNIPKRENIYQNTGKKYQMTTKYTKRPHNRPNGHTIYPLHLLQVPPKFTHIGIFSLKICHLATVVPHLVLNNLKVRTLMSIAQAKIIINAATIAATEMPVETKVQKI
jgi:hypothetical protein